MLTLKTICIRWVVVAMYLINSTSGGYTSEKSKSFYSDVTSILGSADSIKNHRKHTYGGSPAPCVNAASCPTDISSYVTGNPEVQGNPSSCPSLSGCPIAASSPNAISVSDTPQRVYAMGTYGTHYPTSSNHVSDPHQGGFYGYPPYSSSAAVYGLSQGGYVGGTYARSVPFQPPLQSGYGYSGYSAPQRTVKGYGTGTPSISTGSYSHLQPSAPYVQGIGYPGDYGYQGERGYSVLDHSLKTNSEYTEVGTHNGPLQQAPNGYGYGSVYGGYMDMYNRPGF